MRMLQSLGVISLFAALSSCSPSPESALVGKWLMIDPTQTLDLRADGTFNTCTKTTRSLPKGCFVGEYKVDGSNLVFSSLPARPRTILSVSRDELTLAVGERPAFRYVRASTSKPEATIVGKWLFSDTAQSLEFLKSGTVNVIAGGSSAAGTYKFVDKNRLRLDLGGLGGFGKSQLYGVSSVSNNELTLTDDRGQASMFIRAP